MIYAYNEYLLKSHAKETTAQYLSEAAADHVLDELCPRRSNWLTDQIGTVLRNLGHVLIALGRRVNTQSA